MQKSSQATGSDSDRESCSTRIPRSLPRGLAWVLLLALSGCSKNRIDQSSPRRVFESYKQAMIREDWPAAFRCLTKKSQDLTLLSVVIPVSLAAVKEQGKTASDIAAILEKHQVDFSHADDMFHKVKDKAALYGDFIDWAKQNADDQAVKKNIDRISRTKLEKLNIEGDSATARSGKATTHFRKVGGKWYIDLVPNLRKQPKTKPE